MKKNKGINFVIPAKAGIHSINSKLRTIYGFLVKPGMTTGIIIISLFFLFPKSVDAAGYGLSLNPPLLRVNIKPGKTITQVFTISNLTSDDKLMIARIIPFSEADDSGNPVIDLKSGATWLNYFGLANSDIKLGTPFLIKGSSSEQLILTLTVPETAPLRDLYASLLVSTYSNILNVAYQGSLVSATIGSNLLVTINSDINPPTILKVGNIVPVSGSFIKLGNLYLADNITPITFTTLVKNDGDFTAETKGLFRILTRSENPVFLDGILPVNVIARTQRRLTNNEGKNFGFNPGLGQIGIYKANIQIKTDNSNAEGSVDIFFFPFKIGIGISLAVMVLLTIVKSNPKNKKDFIDIDRL